MVILHYLYAESATLPCPATLEIYIMHPNSTITRRVIDITLHAESLVGIVVAGQDIHDSNISIALSYI